MKECVKTKFVDEEAASFYIKKLRQTSKRETVPTSAYLCPHCLSWHLTSQPNRIEEDNKRLREKILRQKEVIKHQAEVISELEDRVDRLIYGNSNF